MSCARFAVSGSLLLLLSVSLPLPLTGCNDESKTTGTMVQVSEEEKSSPQDQENRIKGGLTRKEYKRKNCPSSKKLTLWQTPSAAIGSGDVQ